MHWYGNSFLGLVKLVYYCFRFLSLSILCELKPHLLRVIE